MKVLRDFTNRHGDRQINITLKPGETIVPVIEGRYYKLGYPISDVIASNILAETALVEWCSIEQRWID